MVVLKKSYWIVRIVIGDFMKSLANGNKLESKESKSVFQEKKHFMKVEEKFLCVSLRMVEYMFLAVITEVLSFVCC